MHKDKLMVLMLLSWGVFLMGKVGLLDLYWSAYRIFSLGIFYRLLLQFLEPSQIHVPLQQRDDVRVKCLPVWIFKVVFLRLLY